MAEAEHPSQQFAIQRIYVKDLSFEAPGAPTVFLEKWEPQVSVDLNTQANTLSDGVYEVVLTVTVTTKAGDKTAYLVEVKQAGIFSATGFGEAELGQVLASFCPSVLFPYAREAISDVVTRGSFPQMLLNPVNFDALYAQHLQKVQQKGAAQNPPTH